MAESSLNPFNTTSLAPPPYFPGPSMGRKADHLQDKSYGAPGIIEPIAHIAPNRILEDDALNILREVDTVFLIDDSGSMVSRWTQTAQVLANVAEQAAKYDSDGIDMCFLNSTIEEKHLKSKEEVMHVFEKVQPSGGTPLGKKLNGILKTYIKMLESEKPSLISFLRKRTVLSSQGTHEHNTVRGLNILVLTDGQPTDGTATEKAIVTAANALDKLNKPRNQLGIQFMQIGADKEATDFLTDLDDALSHKYKIRDMVDTVPSKSHGNELTAQQIIKTLVGGINRRLDNQSVIKE